MSSFNGVPVPPDGARIDFVNDKFVVPDNPIIPYIEGDGTGRDIWKASRRVFDAAVEKAFGGKRRVVWYEVFAGEKAFKKFGEWLPAGHARRHQGVSHRHQRPADDAGGRRHPQLECGPAATSESLRLLAAGEIHSGRAVAGAGIPERMNIIIFRENTEDVYAGIEWREGSEQAQICDRVSELPVDEQWGKEADPA